VKGPILSLLPTGLDRTLPLLVLHVLYVCSVPSPTHFTLKIKAANSSKTLVSYRITACHYDPEDHDLKSLLQEQQILHILKIGVLQTVYTIKLIM
jgi:hypothetical protein